MAGQGPANGGQVAAGRDGNCGGAKTSLRRQEGRGNRGRGRVVSLASFQGLSPLLSSQGSNSKNKKSRTTEPQRPDNMGNKAITRLRDGNNRQEKTVLVPHGEDETGVYVGSR